MIDLAYDTVFSKFSKKEQKKMKENMSIEATKTGFEDRFKEADF